ncbi:MAG TPA: hypothetical protein VJ882_04380 [Desulfuromonadales bacterium]|nr:hypothetical protein [Desulfuromonadales bacterium]
MYRHVLVIALALFLLPATAISGSFRLAEDIVLEVELPGERWNVSNEPSSALVESIAEHMHHDLEAQGKDVSEKQVHRAARERLAANELFIRSDSGAHIEIDISPIKSGKKSPSEGTVKSSARYAGQSMASEEGVSKASSEISEFDLPGASVAYRLDIDFVRHEKSMNFLGVIGFDKPYWLYFYGTDPQVDPRDAEEMEKIFQSLRIVRENRD